MYAGELAPAFRGADYSDTAQMIDATTGQALPWDPSDALTWRLFSLSPYRPRLLGYPGFGLGADYGFLPNASAALGQVALLTLSLGAGLTAFPVGGVVWSLPPGATFLLRDPEYQMTLDLVRYGVTIRILDTTLQVER